MCFAGSDWPLTSIGETARNLEVHVNEHSDVNGQSEPTKHINEHPNDKFSWDVLATAHSWTNRRIKEAFYIARFHLELNKQDQSFALTLLPMGTSIRNEQKPHYKSTRFHADFYSDDDQTDRKRLETFFNSYVTIF